MESDVQGNKIEQKIFQQICSFLIFNFIYLFIYFVFVFGILYFVICPILFTCSSFSVSISLPFIYFAHKMSQFIRVEVLCINI